MKNYFLMFQTFKALQDFRQYSLKSVIYSLRKIVLVFQTKIHYVHRNMINTSFNFNKLLPRPHAESTVCPANLVYYLQI